jgi:hypothetical protein
MVWPPVSRATSCALSALEAKRAEHALRADTGRVLRPTRPVVGRAAQACSCAVAGPRQTERALCAWAELGFSPEAM